MGATLGATSSSILPLSGGDGILGHFITVSRPPALSIGMKGRLKLLSSKRKKHMNPKKLGQMKPVLKLPLYSFVPSSPDESVMPPPSMLDSFWQFQDLVRWVTESLDTSLRRSENPNTSCWIFCALQRNPELPFLSTRLSWNLLKPFGKPRLQ